MERISLSIAVVASLAVSLAVVMPVAGTAVAVPRSAAGAPVAGGPEDVEWPALHAEADTARAMVAANEAEASIRRSAATRLVRELSAASRGPAQAFDLLDGAAHFPEVVPVEASPDPDPEPVAAAEPPRAAPAARQAPAQAPPTLAPRPVATRAPAPPPAAVAAAPGGSVVVASWYGPGFYGNRTACGQTYTAQIMGVAHRTLPCGTMVQLQYGAATVTVPVIDRGPFIAGRTLDLSNATRAALGCPDLCTLRMVVLN